MMADDIEKDLLGTWKIVECVSLTGTVEPTGIEGTEFTLDESGDVLWKVSEEAEPMPFFTCETFEVAMKDVPVLKLFGTFAGHIIEFRVQVSDDLMLLTYDRCCMLQCQKVCSSTMRDGVPFTFLKALEEGFFSDISIKSDTGREFHCHKIILNLSTPGIDWTKSSTPLTGLNDDTMQTTLYYLYNECLPRGLSEKVAKSCVKSLEKQPGFAKFVKLCKTFLANTALKQQITSLVNDMHASADRIIELFNGKGNTESTSFPAESLMSNPAKLIYVVKQSMKEAAIASAKLLIVCDLFSRRKTELSREERHEIIKYAKSRLHVFISQCLKFLEVCRQHTNNLTANQMHEFASYLIPEIDPVCDLVTQLVTDVKTVLELVIRTGANTEKQDKADKSRRVGGLLGSTLKKALHMRELKKLKSFCDSLAVDITKFSWRREKFISLRPEEKVRFVTRIIEQIVDQVPLILIRIDEFMAALDEKVSWNEWKYLFKLGTSKVAWGINKTQANRASLGSVLHKICDMVHHDQFNRSLQMLGLLDPSGDSGEAGANANSPTATVVNYAQLNSVQSLCVSPLACDSNLAKKALDILHREEQTDMVFEIIVVQEGGDTVIDHTYGEPISRTERERDVDVTEIKAHRVIIAGRCDWFRRALMSGMRESIDKKIAIYDTNPDLFRVFLHYLYSGQLDSDKLTTDQLADLMSLGDRYEMDCLKSICEQVLKQHLDENCTLFLLSLADQLNAKSLRGAALNYISDNPDVVDCEDYSELPDHLKTEVEETITWHCAFAKFNGSRNRNFSGHSNTETPSSMSSVSEVEELMGQLEMADRTDQSSSSSSSEDMPAPVVDNSIQLESCLQTLRDIIGDTVPREELVRVVLAADYDTNRALNFFFST